MIVYCDESGGVGAGVMTLAGVSLAAEDAAAIVTRMADVVGVRGELKGSRIDLAERSFLVEMLMRHDARMIVATADMAVLRAEGGVHLPEDIDIYARLLEMVVDGWMPQSGGCLTVEIDDGRYDPRLNAMLRGDVQASLGQWGKAQLADSHRSAGVQIADVIANSWYQIGLAGGRSQRIRKLFEPFVASGAVQILTYSPPEPTKG